MAEAVVSFVVERVGDFIIEEGKFLYGVCGQVEDAQTELQLMQGFLRDADAKRRDHEVVKVWVANIRDAAYDLEDIIEAFGLKVASKRKRGLKNFLKRFSCIAVEVVHRHKIGSEIVDITAKISDLRLKMQNYNIIREESGSSTSLQLHESQQRLRRTYSHVKERDVVGLDKSIEEVIMHLVKDDEYSHHVVSIWGMGGLGKTTLAKQVYHHKKVRDHFKCFAWACISQQCQVRAVWIGILTKLLSATDEQKDRFAKMTDDEIAKELYLVQTERRCFVIIDDIWSMETWESLKAAFPCEDTKSKILLTTRKQHVAVHADRNGFLHQLPPLNEDESCELFEKIAIEGRIDIDATVKEKMKELGKKMLRHCAGLPLAITVLAGLLARKNTVNEWDVVDANVFEYIRRGLDIEQEDAGAPRILELSYDDLPYLLKACFLYLGHYPEDFEIRVSRLTELWMAEGLISMKQNSGPTMEDIAYNCLTQLVERCMVQVGERGTLGTIKTCRMHDLMRDLSLLKAKEDNFLQIVNFSQSNVEATHPSSSVEAKPLGKVRRYAIYLDGNVDKLVPSGDESDCRIRSLLYFGPSNWRWTLKSEKLIVSLFKDFKLLRVLKVEHMVSEVELPSEIGNMVHLRLLSLRYSEVKGIPSSLGNLICLQTLHLRVRSTTGREVVIPNVIWKMKQLRYLDLPYEYKTRGIMKLYTLHNIQTLRWLSSSYFDLNDITGLVNLRKLSIKLSCPLKNLEEILKSAGRTLNSIRSLHLYIDEDNNSCAEQLTQIASSCRHVYKLTLGGPTAELPKQLHNYPNLTKLILISCDLKDDQMGILEKLPNLTTLRLYNNVFKKDTKILVFSQGGFAQLRYLSLFDVFRITEWRVEEGAMPSLCRLKIVGCRGLTTVPDGLRHLTTLRELTIRGMPSRFISKIEEGGEDFYKIQHVPSLVIGEPYDPPASEDDMA